MARILVSPSLPPDLTDRILDHVHDDVRTLSACGLVYSSWLRTVRFHRFGAVRLRLWNKIIPFHNLLQYSPTVALYVTSLSMTKNGLLGSNEGAIYGILSTLTNLRALHMAHFIILPEQTHKMIQSLPKSLEEIEVNQMDLPTIGDLVILWTSLPCLRSFTTVETLWFRSHEIPAELWEPGSVRLSLTELHLLWTVRHADVLARWLAAQNVTGQLRACSLYVTPAIGVAAILRSLGPPLETLELIGGTNSAETDEDSDVSDRSSMWMFSDPSCHLAGFTDGGDLVLHSCNLAQCANLRELRFKASLERTRGYAGINDHDLDAVPQFLTQLRAPSIKTLFFAFEATERGIGEFGFLALRSMGAIATPLSRDEFQGLEEVVVQLDQHLDDAVSDDVFAFIRRQLSSVDSRGILSINVVYPIL